MSAAEGVPPVMGRMDHGLDHRWHVALNKAAERWRSTSPPLADQRRHWAA